MSKCLTFSKHKAPQVLALPIGARFQTRRFITFNTIPPTLAAEWQLFPEECFPEAGFFLFMREQGSPMWYSVRCRYRPGDVCHVGVPHWRMRDTDGAISIWDEWSTIERWVDGRNEAVLQDPSTFLASCRRYMAGRFMPGWAATSWARILSATPQRLQDCTEQDAVAELVEFSAHGAPGGGPGWRDYGSGNFVRTCALGSYRSMLNAVHGRDVWAQSPWVWRIEAQICEKPIAPAKEAKKP